jgi:hypothetical protein
MAFVLLLESLLFPNFEDCPNSKKGFLKRLSFKWLVDVTGIEPAAPLLAKRVGELNPSHCSGCA